MDLTTRLGDMVLANPVMVASGCGGSGRDLSRYGDLSVLGAFVTPSVTRDGSGGRPMPRHVETPAGLLSAVGLPGAGIDLFLAADLPWLLRHDIRPIVSVAGASLGELAEVARRVGNTPGVAGLEVNLASVEPGSGALPSGLVRGYARDPVQAARAVSVVRRETAAGVPVLAKLWPGVSAVVDMAAAVLGSGADAIVVSAGLPGLALDRGTLRPRLGGVAGELVGPAVHAFGLATVWEVRRELPDATVVAVGGAASGADVLAYVAAGADAVQVGSALFGDPGLAFRVVDEFADELQRHGFSTPGAARGVAHGLAPSTGGLGSWG